MAGTVDYVRETLEKSYALIKTSAQGIFMDLLKISLAEAFVGLIALLLIGGLAFLLLGASITEVITTGSLAPSLMSNLGIGLAIALPIIIIAVLAGAVLKSVAYSIIGNANAARPTDLMACARKNILPVVKLSLVTWAVMLVLGLPIILSFVVGAGSMGMLVSLAELCVIPLVFAIALVLFIFFAQFSTIEVVLNGKGPIEAIRASISLVKGNFWGVLLVDVVILVAGIGVSLVSGIAQQALRLLMQIFATGGTAGLAVGFTIYLICMLVVSAVVGAMSETVTIPVAYNFWNGKRGV